MLSSVAAGISFFHILEIGSNHDSHQLNQTEGQRTMNSTPAPTPTTVGLTKYIPLIEKILLAALAIGALLAVMQIDTTVASVSLIGLAITYFLSAYRPPSFSQDQSDPFTFRELLALMITPKVLWISSAICAMGIAFYLFNLGNEGYKNMLLIGVMSIGPGTLILFAFLLGRVRYISTVTPVLFRAVPLGLVSLYILFR